MVIYLTRVKHFTLYYYYYNYIHLLNRGHISSREGLAKSFNALSYISRIVYQIEITHTHTCTLRQPLTKKSLYIITFCSRASRLLYQTDISTLWFYIFMRNRVEFNKLKRTVLSSSWSTILLFLEVPLFLYPCEKHVKHDDDEPL